MTRQAIPWSDAELSWIRRNCDMSRADLHQRFCDDFGRRDVSVDNIKALCSRMGWAAGPEGRRRNKGLSRIFSGAETAWLRANATLSRDEVHAAFLAAFPGHDITRAQLISWRKRNGVRTGRTGHFVKGQAPLNKGRKGWCAPGSAKGWFRKGEMRGRAREKYQPIGAERISKGGYLERKIHDGLPRQSRWRAVHQIRWEELNGSVPDSHILKCLDGDRTNTDPSNWAAIPRAMMPRLAGRWAQPYDTAAPEVKPVLLTTAALEHRVRQIRKESLK